MVSKKQNSIKNNLRKGVSPVVATILLLTISVALVTVGFIVYNQYKNSIPTQGEPARLNIIGISSYDFSNDSKGDSLYLTLKNTGLSTATFILNNSEVIISNTTHTFNGWSVFNGTDTTIEPSEIGYLVIVTQISSQQITPGNYHLSINLREYGQIEFDFTITEILPGGSVRVSVTSPISTLLLKEAQQLLQNGEFDLAQALLQPQLNQNPSEYPVPGATINIIDQYGFAVATKQASEVGTAIFKLFPGNYSVKVSLGDLSVTTGYFIHPANIEAPQADTIVTARFSSVIHQVIIKFTVDGTPKANVPIYAIKQVSVGTTTIETIVPWTPIFTNQNGEALLYLTAGDYKFRAIYLGASVKTITYQINSPKNITINVEVGPITVHIRDKLGTPLSNTWVAIYGIQGSGNNKYQTYLGSRYTNETGYAKFGGILTQRFKISIYSLNFVSETYLVVPGNIYEIIIPGNTLYINATNTKGDPVPNMYFYAYDSNGRYVGYGRTNTTGIGALYGLSPDNYSLTYYLNWYSTYKETISFNETMMYNVTIPGIIIYANVSQVLDDGNGSYYFSPLPNHWIYMINQKTGAYVAYAYTNNSGIATFYVSAATFNPNDTYVFRTWYYSYGHYSYYTSAPFNLTINGQIINFTVGGVPIYYRVEDTSGNPATGFRAYLFDNETDWWVSYSWGMNSSGWGVLYGIPGRQYFVVVTHGTLEANSTVFTATAGHQEIFTGFQKVSFQVRVLDENNNPISNRYVYLLLKDKYYGYALYYQYDYTNSQGYADFTGYQGADYLVRTYYTTYFTEFIHNVNDGAVYTIRPNTVYVHLMAKDGTPITGRYFYVYLANTNVYITWGPTTNSTGYSKISLAVGGEYEIRVYGLGTRYAISDPFNITTSNQVIDLYFDVIKIYAIAKDEQGTPLNQIIGYNYYMYLYTSNGTYVSYGYSNSSGWVTFYALNGSEYQVVLGYYFGRRIESDPFNATEGKQITVTITGMKIYVNVTRDGLPVSNAYVYMYTETNRYSGWARSNSSGIATFYGVLNGTYYVRTYMNGYYVKSDYFNATDGLIVNVSSIKQDVTIRVLNANGQPQSGRYVYLLTLEGYWVYGGTTNSAGYVTISASLNAIYKARTYMYPESGAAYTAVSSKFFNNTGTQGTIIIQPTKIYVNVTDGANHPVINRYVYLMQNGTYDSYGRTNSSGIAIVWGVENTTYYVRVYNYGFDYYNFTAFTTPTDGTPIYTGINVGGGHVYVRVLNAQGSPVANSLVQLYAQGQTWRAGYAYTNDTGWAVFYSVGNGTSYKVYSSYLGNYSQYFVAKDGLTIIMQPDSITISNSNNQIFQTTYTETKK